jgi:hypothetical protein
MGSNPLVFWYQWDYLLTSKEFIVCRVSKIGHDVIYRYKLRTCIYYKYAHMHIIVHRYVLNTWPIPAIVRFERMFSICRVARMTFLHRMAKEHKSERARLWNTSSIINTSIILETLLLVGLYNHNHSAMVLSTPVTIGALQCTWTLLDVPSLALCLSMYAKLFQFILSPSTWNKLTNRGLTRLDTALIF